MESRMIIDDHGIERWHNENDQLHREDGPAIILKDGSKYWYRNGQRHRTDGPAVIWPDGTKVWYKNGQLHREDGPAVIRPSGQIEWWVNYLRHSFQEWANELKLDQKTRLELVLKWNPE